LYVGRLWTSNVVVLRKPTSVIKLLKVETFLFGKVQSWKEAKNELKAFTEQLASIKK
jgi:arginine deiminase